MKRVSKDPTARREELVDIAEELFPGNGYEETPVSDSVTVEAAFHIRRGIGRRTGCQQRNFTHGGNI